MLATSAQCLDLLLRAAAAHRFMPSSHPSTYSAAEDAFRIDTEGGREGWENGGDEDAAAAAAACSIDVVSVHLHKGLEVADVELSIDAEPGEQRHIFAALQRGVGTLRSEIAASLRLRRAPLLRLSLCDLQRASNLFSLLQCLETAQNQQPEEQEEAEKALLQRLEQQLDPMQQQRLRRH
ncbi:hypothetical protein cyc_09327 [Cyclospora cayetanensis]|uniref:Uncharacterized protein n=1 Tax=Cyclospora cayetanensis TaxID=88456 RepID=A0A1D3D060_9EIME|nr:hypothetical protein cyc_09327 [Cyclospora cayetanensis]